MKRKLLFSILLSGLLAFFNSVSAKTYDAIDLQQEKVYSQIILNEDDIIRSESGITLSINYPTEKNHLPITIENERDSQGLDASQSIKIKSGTIGGVKIDKWYINNVSAGGFKLNRKWVQGIITIDLQPDTSIIDKAGYFILTDASYSKVCQRKYCIDRRVAGTGKVSDVSGNKMIIKVSNKNKLVCVQTNNPVKIGDLFDFKGKITKFVKYNDGKSIPFIECNNWAK